MGVIGRAGTVPGVIGHALTRCAAGLVESDPVDVDFAMLTGTNQG